MYVLLSLHHHGHRHLRHVKHLSTTVHSQLHVPLSHPTFLIWASNTSLGKTQVSTGLAASSLLNPIPKPHKFLYLKPIQTSFPSESNSSFVLRKLSCLSLLRRHNHPHFSLFSSNHILKEMMGHRRNDYVFTLILLFISGQRGLGSAGYGSFTSPNTPRFNSRYQQEPFRLPGILVGDGRLGGISGTISAYESLKLRGYDIAAVVFEDHGLVNEMPLLSYLRNR
nr:bifunctional dethiobiotin synthetase/7,8-diamino-pelargonic acid aminotransferase, mitochondrial-like [Quercus suber]